MPSKILFEKKIMCYRMERVIERKFYEFPMTVQLTVDANVKRENVDLETVKEAKEKWDELFAVLPDGPIDANTGSSMLDFSFPKCKEFVEANMMKWCKGATWVTFIVSVDYDGYRYERAGDFLYRGNRFTYTQFDHVRDMPIRI